MIKKEKKEKEQKINIPDIQAERMLVSKCLTDQEYAALVFERFDKRWFENKNLAIALEICIAYYKKYVTLPTRKTLDSILDKMSEVKKIEDVSPIKRELDTLTDVCAGMEEKFIRDSIVDFIKSKAGYYTILDNLEEIRENKDVSKCISSFQGISEITFDLNLGFNYFEEFATKHEQEVCNPLSRLSLGFDSFDKLTHGGVYANGRCLFVMMGQPGIGKSLFLSNFAVNFLKQNKRVLIFSLEMSEHIYGTRVDAHLSGEDINELQFKFDRVKEKVMDFKELYPNSSLFIKEYPPNTINCNHLINFTNKLVKSKGKPDVIIVDYINLLNPATNRFGSSENTYTAVGTVAKELRAMSYIFECPVISVTQVNREGYDTEEVSMGNTSESAGINQHCDFMGAIFQLDGDRDANKMNVKILKNRLGGQVGKTCNFFINYRNLSLKDYSDVVGTEGGDSKSPSDVDKVLGELESI